MGSSIISEESPDDVFEEDVEEKVQQMMAVRDKLFVDAAENIRVAQASYKKYYDRRRCQSEVFIIIIYVKLSEYSYTFLYNNRYLMLAQRFWSVTARGTARRGIGCSRSGLAHIRWLQA